MNNFFLCISTKHRLYLLPLINGSLPLGYTYNLLVVEPLPVQKLDADFLILIIVNCHSLSLFHDCLL